MKRGAHILYIFLFLACSNYALSNPHTTDNSSNSDKSEKKNESTASSLDMFLVTDLHSGQEEIVAYKASIQEFIDKMHRKIERQNDEVYALENLFYKVHNKFLKNYGNYVEFKDIFDNGEYDCVTGTALYAIILDELDYTYKIHEFDYHVLLTVNLDGQEIMFESTDFFNGFVKDSNEIANRLEFYRESKNDKQGDHYIFKSNNNRHINLRELAGLLYFNLAVEQYNLQNIEFALKYLEKAEELYSSDRINEFRVIIEKLLQNENYFSLNQ